MQAFATRRRWWLEATEIQTERLVLHAISPADAGELGRALWTHRHHLAPWIDVPTIERSEPWWQQRTRQLANAFAVGAPLLYTVRDAHGDFLGCAGLTPTSRPALTCADPPRFADPGPPRRALGFATWALSYWLVATHTGQGYAREAAAALAWVAFEHAGARRLLIQCRSDNLRSAAVARALGFARTRLHHGVQHWTLNRDPRHAIGPVMRDATPGL